MKYIDYLLDRITMYRLVLYVLSGQISMAVILAFFNLLHFPPFALLFTTAFLVLMCWATNVVFAYVFEVPTNVESAYITALILALILDPAQSLGDLKLLGWVAIIAMASKFIIAIGRKHIFNPAAIAVVITAFAIGGSASWWVGTASMLPVVLIGGWLIVRKLRQEDMVLLFCAVALIVTSVLALFLGKSFLTEITFLIFQSPLFFFGSIMLTEPLTEPPTRMLRRLYGALTAILFIPLIHVGSIFSTPELALVTGNVFSYLVSPKQKVLLKLNKKLKLAPGIVDFVFKPSQQLTFAPGQYMEFTLDHYRPDSRGNRRYFTLASSPTEKNVHLGVRFYNKSSTYKRSMYWMDGKTHLIAGQIAGDFTLPADPTEKLVFIAGGIGITPFRSMLKYLLDTRQRRDIILLYVNKEAQEIVYLDVLNAAQALLGVKTFYTLTNPNAVPRNWNGFVGRVDEQMILHAMPDFDERTFYLSGPPDMVRSCEQVLKNMSVSGHQIKKDFFPGLV